MHRNAVRRPSQARREAIAPHETSLEALTVARGRYARISRVVRRAGAGAGASLSVAVILSALTGTVLALALPAKHTCVATIGIGNPISEEQLTDFRRQLVDFAARETSVSGTLSGGAGWFVDQPDANSFRLGLRLGNGHSGAAEVCALAEDFLAERRRAASLTRDTPSVAEVALGNYASDLRSRTEALRHENRTSAEASNASAAVKETEKLRRSWENLRSRYTAARRHLADASAELERLQSAGPPSYGLVSAKRRQAALRKDAALQQDLRELEVNLTELKRRILAVWQDASPWLERMALDVDQLIAESEFPPVRELDSGPDGGDRPRSGWDSPHDLHASAMEYRHTLAPFAATWTAAFTTIRRLTPDPYTGEILKRYDALQRRVNDFLYESVALFTQMRSALHAMDKGDTARHYVSQSKFVRRFRTLQSAHHQFEFESAALETSNNFRLDAALQAARGLKRRSQHRIREIERSLQAEALREARRMRTEQMDLARQRTQVAREEVDRLMDELIALQTMLNSATLRTEALLRGLARTQALAGRLDLAQTELARIDQKVAALAEKRIADADQAELELISCQALEGAEDWVSRAQLAGLGAAVTLIAVLLGQWWASRRT